MKIIIRNLQTLFDIRNKAEHTEKYSVRLEQGSLLLMKGDLQAKWDHRIDGYSGKARLTFK